MIGGEGSMMQLSDIYLLFTEIFGSNKNQRRNVMFEWASVIMQVARHMQTWRRVTNKNTF